MLWCRCLAALASFREAIRDECVTVRGRHGVHSQGRTRVRAMKIEQKVCHTLYPCFHEQPVCSCFSLAHNRARVKFSSASVSLLTGRAKSKGHEPHSSPNHSILRSFSPSRSATLVAVTHTPAPLFPPSHAAAIDVTSPPPASPTFRDAHRTTHGTRSNHSSTPRKMQTSQDNTIPQRADTGQQQHRTSRGARAPRCSA